MLARLVMLVSLVGLVISACGGMVPINAPDVRPVIDPSPVSVTVHYDESLRNHHCTGDEGYISFSWTFALGPPSIEMFNPIFATLFKDVDFSDDHNESESSSEQREIIELHLTEFTGCQASWPIVGTTVVEIAYEAIGEKIHTIPVKYLIKTLIEREWKIKNILYTLEYLKELTIIMNKDNHRLVELDAWITDLQTHITIFKDSKEYDYESY